jgi:hypothetical protein
MYKLNNLIKKINKRYEEMNKIEREIVFVLHTNNINIAFIDVWKRTCKTRLATACRRRR